VLGTPLLGLVGTLGCQALCAYIGAMAVTERTSAASLAAVTAELAEMERRREALTAALVRWPAPWPRWRRLVQSVRWFAALEAALLVLLSLPGLFAGELTSGLIWGYAITLGSSLALAAHQPAAVGALAARRRDRRRDVAVQVATVVVMIPILILVLKLADDTSAVDAVALDPWMVVPMLVSLAALLVVYTLAERLGCFLPTRIAALDRRIERLQRSQSLAKELLEKTVDPDEIQR
jgi:hypothetical protein